MNAKIIEIDRISGAYDLPARRMIIDHPKHGRLLLAEGYGGENTLAGGAYRYRHGVACKLQPGDTIESLDAAEWNESTSLYMAAIEGYDDSRPLLDWTGDMIDRCAEAAI